MTPTRSGSLIPFLLLFTLVSGCDKDEPSKPQPDTTPPDPVTDLAAGSPTLGSMLLTWSAPADPKQHRVSGYEVRYAQSPVTERNWVYCRGVDDEPTPRSPGAQQSMTVYLPYSGTQYWFGIKSRDGAGNVSEVSNSPSGWTNE